MRHNGKWDERQWERIEEEFGESAREVVRVMHHEQRVPLRHVAAALYVSEQTIRKWCKRWGLATRRRGFIKTNVPGKVELRARLLGYTSIQQAIADLRASGLRWNDVKLKLKCGDATLSRHYPDGARGLYNDTPEGRAVKSMNARRLNAAKRNGKMPPLGFVTPYWGRKN